MLNSRKSYIQIALNKDIFDNLYIISKLPKSDNILLEAGTVYIKKYGARGIKTLKNEWQNKVLNPYIVADMKCMDRGATEVEIALSGGATGITCMGLAPIETINEFIKICSDYGADSIIDMMNVEFPFEILQQLKKPPSVVMLHRGVDERLQNKYALLPLEQIHRIRGTYNNTLIALAGGETKREVQRTLFNDAHIAIVWEEIAKKPMDTENIVSSYLSYIK